MSELVKNKAKVKQEKNCETKPTLASSPKTPSTLPFKKVFVANSLNFSLLSHLRENGQHIQKIVRINKPVASKNAVRIIKPETSESTVKINNAETSESTVRINKPKTSGSLIRVIKPVTLKNTVRINKPVTSKTTVRINKPANSKVGISQKLATIVESPSKILYGKPPRRDYFTNRKTKQRRIVASRKYGYATKNVDVHDACTQTNYCSRSAPMNIFSCRFYPGRNVETFCDLKHIGHMKSKYKCSDVFVFSTHLYCT